MSTNKYYCGNTDTITRTVVFFCEIRTKYAVELKPRYLIRYGASHGT